MSTFVAMSARSDFLDRIRVVLTMLVILHHTSIMFGGSGGWYLQYEASSPLNALALTVLCAVDQSFFMGMFFLLAGYFTPRSLASKGHPRFILDRLFRLGVPLMVYGFLIGPFTRMLSQSKDVTELLSNSQNLLLHPSFNIGPLWFAWALLIFSSAYILISRFIPQIKWSLSTSALRHSAIFAGLILWGVFAFVLRLWVHTGDERWMLQIGFFASYILLFFLGCACAQHRILETIDKPLARPWFWIGVLTIPTLFVYAILGGAFEGVDFPLSGGWTLPSLAYAFWEPFVGCGIILMLLWRFRVAQQPSRIWPHFAHLAYAAFIVHPPVVVAMGLLGSQWQLSSIFKFAIAGLLSVSLSFMIAFVLVRIPGARRIL
jgi:hypothetical protein